MPKFPNFKPREIKFQGILECADSAHSILALQLSAQPYPNSS